VTGDAAARTTGVAGFEPGRIANLDQLASATHSVVAAGPAAGARALDVRVHGGIDVRLLPDRGFDLGAAWFAGVPLAWISGVGEHGPLPVLREQDWNRAFGGGLVATCGLRNVGAASEGHPQHGEFSQRRADGVAVTRSATAEAITVEATARIVEADALAFRFEVQRTVRTRTGEGRLELTDVTRNLGSDAEPAPLLYHCNIGAPLWAPGATLAVTGEAPRPRDADAAQALATWHEAPPVLAGAPERVFEHPLTPDDDGWASATLTSPAAGLELTLRWDAATLPRLWQWVHPAPGVSVLGLEPANCSVLGRAADRTANRLPVLEPGEERVTRLELRVRTL